MWLDSSLEGKRTDSAPSGTLLTTGLPAFMWAKHSLLPLGFTLTARVFMS